MGVGKGLVTSIGVTVVALGAAMPVGAARIIDEWRPGVAETGLGGDLTVDGYGVSGLGFYRVTLDDGASALAVCVQADVGHSASAEYVAEAPATITPELDYLLWRYASPQRPEATNDQAAAINVLSWWYAGARRRSGGPVWRDPTGSAIELDVVGVGRLGGIEAAVHGLREESTRQRGPWELSDLASVDGVARVRVTGPGGPISGAVVTFTSGDASLDAVTDTDGLASAPITVIDVLVAQAQSPGPTIALAAPGSQRLVMAGPPITIEASLVVPRPPTTTTTIPPTTTIPTTTTIPPTTTTTSSTTLPTTTTPASTPTTVPATLPRTGDGGRTLTRVGAVAFAGGALLVLLAAPRFSPGAGAPRADGARPRPRSPRSRRTTGRRR